MPTEMPRLLAPSLYAQYALERCGHLVYETDAGFVTYEQSGTTLYIRELFVTAEARRQGHGTQLADAVCERGKAAGCTLLLGTVDPTTHGATASLIALIGYGMQVTRIHNGLIVLEKPLT